MSACPLLGDHSDRHAASPLNPALHQALAARFGEVRISNTGRSSLILTRPVWHGEKLRQELSPTQGGEHYAVCCVFCGDTRFRLSLHYLWGTIHSGTGRRLFHLAHCFNEECLRDRPNQRLLYDQLRRSTDPTQATFREVPAVPASVQAPVPPALPENLIDLRDPDCPDTVRSYLEGRRFDLQELATRWGVGFSAGSSQPRPGFRERLVLPLHDAQGQCVGWQARRLDDDHASPKYLTSAGTAKSHLLYGLPQAVARQNGPIVVVEGATDVWRLGANAVALLGKSASAAQLGLLTRRLEGRPLVILLDVDAEVDADELKRRLSRQRALQNDAAPVVSARLPPRTKDVGECERDEAWACVAAALRVPRKQLMAELQLDVPQTRRSTRHPRNPSGKREATGTSPEIAQSSSGTCSDDASDSARRIERQVKSLASAMTRTGVELDAVGLRSEGQRLQRATHCLQAQADEMAGRKINAIDAADVARLLYGELGLPVLKTTRKGCPSNDVATLQSLSAHHPLPGIIAELMDCTQRARIVGEMLARLDEDGRLHPQLDPEGTETGRFTSRAPCLLALPRPLRRFVTAPKRRLLVQADYAHFELRVLAVLTCDEALRARLDQPEVDPHAEAAGVVFGVDRNEVTPVQRQVGKQVNFALIYGQTPQGLAASVGCDLLEAERLIARFFEAFPGVARWIKATHDEASAAGCVTTLLGRRRELADLRSSVPAKRARGLRQAVNTRVQGTAAELFKIALLRLKCRLPAQCRMLLPLHDGVLVEAPAAAVDELRGAMTEAMSQGFPGDIRFPIEVQAGPDWGALQEVE